MRYSSMTKMKRAVLSENLCNREFVFSYTPPHRLQKAVSTLRMLATASQLASVVKYVFPQSGASTSNMGLAFKTNTRVAIKMPPRNPIRRSDCSWNLE